MNPIFNEEAAKLIKVLEAAAERVDSMDPVTWNWEQGELDNLGKVRRAAMLLTNSIDDLLQDVYDSSRS